MMIKIPYSKLNILQKEKVCELVIKINPEQPETLDTLNSFFGGDLFNKGDTFFTYWEDEFPVFTIGAIIKDIIYKNEVFIIDINVEEHNLSKIKTLIEETEEFLSTYNPQVIKLSLNLVRRNYLAEIEKCGYKNSFYIIVMNYFPTDNNWQEISQISSENLNLANIKLYREINNNAFWNSSNEGIISEEETMDLIKSGEQNSLTGIFKYEGNEIGIFDLEIADKIGIITTICISPEFQGKGFGKLILKFVTSKLMNYGAEEIRLKVLSTNEKAFNMYKNFGFEVVGLTSVWLEKRLK
jgi:ribosomal protein S18 acetylase RimI-like enzyme